MNRIAKAHALALLLFASAALVAQEYSFRTFGNAEGLSNLAVRQIYQDHVGFIWVSTENGIFRYDGERFEAFGQAQGIPANAGVAFGDAPDGSLLVGGDIGLYHLRGNRFEKVPANFKTINWAQGIQADGNGHTYIGTDSGLVLLSSKAGRQEFSLFTFPQLPGVSERGAFGVLVDGDAVWYGCGLELCRMDPHQRTVFGRTSGLPPRRVLSIRKDRVGNIWVRQGFEGVFVMPSGKSRFQRPDLLSSAKAIVGSPALDSDGRILLPAPDGLLIRGNNGWQKIDHRQGLRGAVYAVMGDRQHSTLYGFACRAGDWCSGAATESGRVTPPRTG